MLISLDVVSLYTNVLVDEAIALAADKIYSNSPQQIEKSIFVELMKVAVKNVKFQVGQEWFEQVDGLAMGSKLAVFLANISLKSFEPFLGGPIDCLEEEKSKEEEETCSVSEKDPCGKCGKRVTARGYSVQCNRCAFWYHRACLGWSVKYIRSIPRGTWHCGCRVKLSQRQEEPSRLFHRYMDDILRSIKEEEIEVLLGRINSLHPNLKFTVEKESDSQLPFLDMVIERRDGQLTSGWHQKPTDTGLCLSYHACAPQRYKRNTIQGMVHRIHNACSTWQKFHDGLTRAKDIWEANHYPPSFFNPIVRHTLEKILREKVPSAEPSETKNKKK